MANSQATAELKNCKIKTLLAYFGTISRKLQVKGVHARHHFYVRSAVLGIRNIRGRVGPHLWSSILRAPLPGHKKQKTFQ